MNKISDTDTQKLYPNGLGTLPAGVLSSSYGKIQYVKKSSVIFGCHPLAVPAYTSWLAVAYDESKLELKANIDEYRIKHPPLPVQKVEEKNNLKNKLDVLYFINCFEVFHTLAQLSDSELIPIVFLENLNEITIQYRAWIELVQWLFNNKKNRANWSDALNCINKNMPEVLIEYFFNDKSLSITTLCKHIGISIRQFENIRSQSITNQAAKTEFTFNAIIARTRNVRI